jgi:hypothetical protein
VPHMIEEPVTKPVDSPVSEAVTTHPAFAQIAASRVQGRANLYDSDFRHQNYMTITIRGSVLHRGLNRDWHSGEDEMIEVALSESQWATFVSSPNMGTGVPCTLQRLQGKFVPGLPDPASRVDQFASELQADLAETVDLMDKALIELQELGLSKSKQERVATALNAARRQLKSNIPFVAKQFSEHMEDTVERAKQEVHGFMTSTISRAGLTALTEGKLPLLIDEVTMDVYRLQPTGKGEPQADPN